MTIISLTHVFSFSDSVVLKNTRLMCMISEVSGEKLIYGWAIDIYSETPIPHCFGKVNFSHLLKNHTSERSLIMMNSQASNFTLFIHVQGSMPYHLSIKFPPIAPKDLRTEHRSQSPQIVFFRKLNPCEPKFCYHLSTVFPSCISVPNIYARKPPKI